VRIQPTRSEVEAPKMGISSEIVTMVEEGRGVLLEGAYMGIQQLKFTDSMALLQTREPSSVPTRIHNGQCRGFMSRNMPSYLAVGFLQTPSPHFWGANIAPKSVISSTKRSHSNNFYPAVN